MFLRRVDGHAALANTRLMQLAGMDATTPDPEGGTILRRKDDSPSGVMLALAHVRNRD